MWKIQLSVLIYYLIFVLFISTISLVFHFSIQTTASSIQTLMRNGEKVINPATLNIVMQIALMEESLDVKNYDQVLFPVL